LIEGGGRDFISSPSPPLGRRGSGAWRVGPRRRRPRVQNPAARERGRAGRPVGAVELLHRAPPCRAALQRGLVRCEPPARCFLGVRRRVIVHWARGRAADGIFSTRSLSPSLQLSHSSLNAAPPTPKTGQPKEPPCQITSRNHTQNRTFYRLSLSCRLSLNSSHSTSNPLSPSIHQITRARPPQTAPLTAPSAFRTPHLPALPFQTRWRPRSRLHRRCRPG